MKGNNHITLIICLLFCGSIFVSCAHKSGPHGKSKTSHVERSNMNYREPANDTERKTGKHTKVSMRKEGGVYLVPITVNGLNLDFIFDIGASTISISSAEAMVMIRQGKITQEDIIGQAQFMDANGGISAGTIVLLRSVQIGDIALQNIQATVVDNIQAPLLLGQSALAKFGKVTIDYENNILEFN